jgi:hypothetical protein
MLAGLAASISDFVLRLALAPADQDASNRFSFEGLTFGSGNDGALEIAIRKFEAASLRVASGPFKLEVGRFALHRLVALVRIEGGKPRVWTVEAASAELAAVKVHAPLVLSRQPKGGVHALHAQGGTSASADSTAGAAAAGSWCLGPLAAAHGRIRAEIVDAHLLFDADVTVPLHQGQVDFNKATVEHVGPDSRMGVSRLGLYVDAPNGRSYLYQFPSAPVAGVEYERRGALPGPWGTDRGNLRLQEFGEWLLRQPGGGQFLGLTEQARLLFDRTAVSGEVRLGDGRFAAPGVQADVVGSAEGRNAVRVHSEAVGRGLAVEMTSLSVRRAVLGAGEMEMTCNEVAGAIMLRLDVDGAQLGSGSRSRR